jgi:putative two-component system response regulator
MQWSKRMDEEASANQALLAEVVLLRRRVGELEEIVAERSVEQEQAHITSLDLNQAQILIVDDRKANTHLLEMLFRGSGYSNIVTETDSRKVLELVEGFGPDLILLDLHMPHMDGFKVLEKLREVQPIEVYLPILVITADISPQAKQKALLLGAKDFITKPFDPTETLLRSKNLLETRFLYKELQRQNQTLEQRVRDRTAALHEAQLEVLRRLALAAEYRDDDTGQHTQRVGRMAALLASRLGHAEDDVELIELAAPLHDVGKIGLPDAILLKPGKLTPDEFAQMKLHTKIGARILAGSSSPLLQMAEMIARYHHERWDGSGYEGLAGEAIPEVARIVAIADVFDALTHVRPYKRAWPLGEAVEELHRQSGYQFDPRMVPVFLEVLRGEGLIHDGEQPEQAA